jgi:hypothetical protein
MEIPPTPNEIPSIPNTPKLQLASLVDRFLAYNFFFGKVVAAIMAFVFLLAFAGSLIFALLSGGPDLKPPKFDDFAGGSSKKADKKNNVDRSDLETKRAVEKKFGDRLTDLVKKYSLPNEAYEALQKVLVDDIPESYWTLFVSGLEDVLKANAAAQAKKLPEAKESVALVNAYISKFQGEIENEDARKTAAGAARLTAFGVAGGCCLATFLMLLIPAVFKIEEHTRAIRERQL